MATKFLDYTGLSHLWSKFKEWCNSIFVTKATDEDITGTKTFVGSKKIAFKQSGANDKLGFTLFNNSGNEQGYLEYNPTNKIAGVPLMTLGNYATATNELTYVGFRRYSNISGASGAYNLLAPLISDAKTPFNLTTTYTNFYLPLGISDGTNIVTASNSGVIDISSLLPTVPDTSTFLTSFSTLDATKLSGIIPPVCYVDDLSTSEFYVNPTTGSDDNDGLSELTPFATIYKALSQSNYKTSLTQTINLASGTYDEHVAIGNRRSINFNLLGDVTFNDRFTVKDNSRCAVNGSNYSLTIKGTGDASSSGTTKRVISIEGSSTLNTSVNTLNIIASSGAFQHVILIDTNSSISTSSLINITINSAISSFGITIYLISNSSWYSSSTQINITNNSSSQGTIWFCAELGSVARINNCAFSVSGSFGNTIYAYRNAFIYLNSCNLGNSTTASVNGMRSSASSAIFLNNCWGYVISSSGNVVTASDSSIIYATGNSAVTFKSTASVNAIIMCERDSVFAWTNGTLALSGTVSGATVYCYGNSYVYVASGVTVGGTVNGMGRRYLANFGGQIVVDSGGANRFPGPNAGAIGGPVTVKDTSNNNVTFSKSASYYG